MAIENNYHFYRNVINSILTWGYIDNKGKIYVGAVGEFGYLEPDKKGRKIYVSLTDKLKKEEKVFGEVWRLFTTSHGIYFMTKSKIFRYFNEKTEIQPGK